jgi:hypothetical protein
MTITKTMEASFLSDTDLNLVVGGLSDNPFSDDANQRAGAMIRSGGFGAAIGGNLMNGAGSHGGAIPFPGWYELPRVLAIRQMQRGCWFWVKDWKACHGPSRTVT